MRSGNVFPFFLSSFHLAPALAKIKMKASKNHRSALTVPAGSRFIAAAAFYRCFFFPPDAKIASANV